MRKITCLAVVCALIIAWAAGAAMSASITHPQSLVYQAYKVTAPPAVKFGGFLPVAPADRAALPGFFDICPGTSWSNFVSAFKANQPYTIKTVVFVKTTPQTIQCSEVFTPHQVSQLGPGIRLHWPLMYEVPGTLWTLTILYGTKYPWVDGSSTVAAVVHQDVWTWKVDATWDSLSDLLVLFHELPFGLDEVPLIGDEVLYPQLQTLICNAKAAQLVNNKYAAAGYLSQFELTVADACIGTSPSDPAPSGWGQGIAQTSENPACCKLLVDAEYLFQKYGIASFGG